MAKVPAVVAKTTKLVESMTPELQKVYHKINKGLTDFNKADILTRYDWGVLIEKVRNTPRTETYGEGAVTTLGEALGIDPRNLYQMGDLAQTWTKEEIVGILEASTANGRALTWSHLRTLCNIPDDKLRVACTNRCVNEAMTCRDLDEMVQAKLDKARGANEAVPARKVQTVANQLTKQCKSITGKGPDYNTRLFDQLDSAGAEVVNDSLMDAVGALSNAVEEAEEFLRIAKRRIYTATERLANIQRGKEALASKINASDDDDDDEPEEDEEDVDFVDEDDVDEEDEDLEAELEEHTRKRVPAKKTSVATPKRRPAVA